MCEGEEPNARAELTRFARLQCWIAIRPLCMVPAPEARSPKPDAHSGVRFAGDRIDSSSRTVETIEAETLAKVEVLADLETVVHDLMEVHEAKRVLWMPSELLAPPPDTDPD